MSVAASMKNVDAIFCVSDKAATVGHTTARKEATAVGVRYYGIFQIPIDDLVRGVSRADIQLIRERTEAVAQKLSKTKSARVTSPSGTDITMSLAGRQGLALNPMSSTVASLPYYAEAAIAPVEGTAEGIIVADLAVSCCNCMLREPLHYTVKAGKVVDISGSTEVAEKVRKMVTMDENATNIAELGIGTSHIIPWEMYGTRRDYARIGTAHIAIGRNNDIGGETLSHIHVDALFSQATIELDHHCVLRECKLLI